MILYSVAFLKSELGNARLDWNAGRPLTLPVNKKDTNLRMRSAEKPRPIVHTYLKQLKSKSEKCPTSMTNSYTCLQRSPADQNNFLFTPPSSPARHGHHDCQHHRGQHDPDKRYARSPEGPGRSAPGGGLNESGQ